jgi:hypothetical protein
LKSFRKARHSSAVGTGAAALSFMLRRPSSLQVIHAEFPRIVRLTLIHCVLFFLEVGRLPSPDPRGGRFPRFALPHSPVRGPRKSVAGRGAALMPLFYLELRAEQLENVAKLLTDGVKRWEFSVRCTHCNEVRRCTQRACP